MNRRDFFHTAGVLGAGMLASPWSRAEDAGVVLPFENGGRPLVKYPQKRPLIRLTTRPPQLETPFGVFNESILTPNNAFFVRYHLAGSPPPMELLAPETFRLEIKGKVNSPLSLSLDDLKKFEPVEIVAVNQCSGNSRGFFKPRVPGGQLGNGAMGNARWKGARLSDVLNKAGVAAGAKEVAFNGLDKPPLPTIPDFVKTLDVDHVLNGDVMLAYEMNGEPLPWLNGYPLRLVVPGFYGTYWVKHLNEITVLDEAFTGFWMSTAYRIPANDGASVKPGGTQKTNVPISRLNVRSFITSHADGAKVPAWKTTVVKGIAFDAGHGIKQVLFSSDGGKSWSETKLGEELGKYSFRPWTFKFLPQNYGNYELRVKATNRFGQSQPMEPLWNPAGYMRNVVETVRVIST